MQELAENLNISSRFMYLILDGCQKAVIIGKSSPCSGGSVLPTSLSEWSFTICPTPYNRK